MDMLTDGVHEDAVIVAFEGVAEGEVALDEDVDGENKKCGKDNHNPSATDGHLPKGERFGRFSGNAVEKNEKRIHHCFWFFVCLL